ncbi:unnamed protein product [Chrysodeixis includens]|uniref:Lipase domain-containing protein n=1 Tax=Chrysodeixis includens TaxID=689277 RepID=A0A9P0BWH8_CHRIL|nr:unnamed protein product [Chrysodeixis includens]
MRIFIVVAAFVALCSGHAIPETPVDRNFIPTIPGDNSHYVEGESRYIWMGDEEGNPVLVDLDEPVDENIVNARNGANNQYWLFTRRNPNNHQQLINGNLQSVRNSNYNSGRSIKVIVHGLNNNGGSHVNNVIRQAFLAVEDANVIVVDWRGLANSGYSNAFNGVPNVGQHLGDFLMWLIGNAGGNWNNVHLVGHSLGAHVIGNAGRRAGGRPRRITGLDPAGPGWGGNGNALNRNSGRYVECIHTDGRVTGIMNAIGDADFYPNGGRNPQPGCTNNVCSHGRANDLFASTVRHNHLVGRRCPNIWEAELSTCNGANFHMGNGNLGKSGSGLYALRTGRAWPF